MGEVGQRVIDWDQPYNLVLGNTGARYEQRGRYFNAGGFEVDTKGKIVYEPPKTPAIIDIPLPEVEPEPERLKCPQCDFVVPEGRKNPMVSLKTHMRIKHGT